MVIVVVPTNELILTPEQLVSLKEILQERPTGELKQMATVIEEILNKRKAEATQ